MQSEYNNIKTTCTKKITAEVPLTTEKEAEIAGVSVSLAKKIKTGKRNAESKSGQKLAKVQTLWSEKSNLLIQEIKRIVTL
jgi:hypothetical protein